MSKVTQKAKGIVIGTVKDVLKSGRINNVKTSAPKVKVAPEICSKKACEAIQNATMPVKAVSPSSKYPKGSVAALKDKMFGGKSIAERYADVKFALDREGVPMPKILNNKMSLEDRIEYLWECYVRRSNKKEDLAQAFLGVGPDKAEKFVK